MCSNNIYINISNYYYAVFTGSRLTISHLYVDSMGLRCLLLLFHILNIKHFPSGKSILSFIDLVFPKPSPQQVEGMLSIYQDLVLHWLQAVSVDSFEFTKLAIGLVSVSKFFTLSAIRDTAPYSY